MKGLDNFVVFQGRKAKFGKLGYFTCIFQKILYFQHLKLLLCHYDVIICVFLKDFVTLPFLKEEAGNFVIFNILVRFPLTAQTKRTRLKEHFLSQSSRSRLLTAYASLVLLNLPRLRERI